MDQTGHFGKNGLHVREQEGLVGRGRRVRVFQTGEVGVDVGGRCGLAGRCQVFSLLPVEEGEDVVQVYCGSFAGLGFAWVAVQEVGFADQRAPD